MPSLVLPRQPVSTLKTLCVAANDSNKGEALDNAPLGIRVNSVCPTWTDTPMTRRATDVAPGLEQALLATIPLGRLGRPEEAADAVIFLCSPRSSFTTGSSLVLDGGMTLSCSG
jgi:NAD(P)-dependent dehydrogenase (short-subunit alcohol dehydrogenase family)